jgi:hypothetical protein
MKILIAVINIIILSILILPATSAKPSDKFIDNLANLMWKDCQGKDIHINNGQYICSSERCINVIPWPYNITILKVLLKAIGEQQSQFTSFDGTCENKIMESAPANPISGCNIITIVGYGLTVNGNDYFLERRKS